MNYSSGDARAAILKRIRDAEDSPKSEAALHAEYQRIPREYRRTGTLSLRERLAMFEHRLCEYDALVYEASHANAPEVIARILSGRGKSRIAIPLGISPAWLPLGFSFLPGDGLSASELDQLDSVLTGCTVAIADTGTIVLQNAPNQGPRRLSLVPDYHLCVVGAEQVVETVPEAFDALDKTKELPATFISGPSATADIEMTRIKGVHGPRFLDVVVIQERPA